ncbi:caspase-3 [Exaiptasia diaphana]|uniref:Caspase-3 n=1 Tax=Exaiptasia diaphana TaxID=2652724 RepID=A0A913WTG6_EXADI|nr:caspase-3 [Exaiptasia diaphana]KXJ20965.1 Caspase-7 [Exaiptasia diaphana]
MEQIHRDALRSNRVALIRDLEASKVASNLYGAGILDENDKDTVQAKSTREERAQTLLDMLPRKGPKAFNAFCDALIDISPHLERLLNPSSQPTQGAPTSESDERVTRAAVHPRSVESTFSDQTAEKTPIASTDGASENSGEDNPDGGLSIFGSGSTRTRTSEPIDTRSMYKMDKTPRGVAVIINNKSFLPASGMHRYPRNGTDVDRDALDKVFQKLGFNTLVYNDQSVYEIQKIFKSLAARDYSKENALIVSILTHGEEGILYATDGTIQIRDMMRWFKGTNLVGKPKIFIFQACQGHEYMDGVDATDAPPADKRVQIPVEADFLYAYSTVPGYYSWRNSVNGSWFIQSIAEVFDKYAKTTDLLTMMTRVNALVATYQSRTNDPYSDRKKQIPSIVSMMRKDFYFYPENITNGNN